MDKTNRNQRVFTFLSALLIILAEAGIMGAIWLFYYNSLIRIPFWTKGHLFLMAIYIAVLFFFMRLYGAFKINSQRRIELLFASALSVVCANLVFYAEIVLLAYELLNPLPVILGMILQGVLISIWILSSTALYRMLFPPLEVLLIYEGRGADEFMQKVATRRHQFKITGRIRADGDLSEIYKAIDSHQAVMMWDVPTIERNIIFKYCYERSVMTYVMPKISDIILNGSEAIHVFDTPLLLTKSHPLEFEQVVVKRALDLLLAILLTIFTAPIMLLAALFIKLYDGGPVLYKQVRCTLDHKEFSIYKFRSMIIDAEKDGVARLASRGDERITPVGRIIRKVRIDELPQLFNILKGDMSFVGPRPERPEIIERYTKLMPEFSYRVKVKAGLSGYAQIYGKYNTRPYDKLKLDLYYIEHYSIWLDLKLIILTLKILMTLESTEGIDQGAVLPFGKEDGDGDS